MIRRFLFLLLFFSLFSPVLSAGIPIAHVKNVKTIAVMLPLSGRASPVGRGIWNAIEMVVFDTRTAHIRWRFLDTQSTPTGTKTAVRQLINDVPDVILGPLFNSHTQIVRNMVDDDIPILSFSNASIANSANTYYFGYALQPQGKGVAHIVLQLDKQNPLIVLPDNVYGKTLYKGIYSVFPQQPVLYYKPNQLNYRDFIKEIRSIRKNMGYDSIIIDDNNPQTIRALTSEMDFYDIFDTSKGKNTIPIIGGTGWSNVQNINKEPTLIGGYFLTTQVKTADMVARYSQMYNTPSTNLTTLAYDLAYLALGAVQAKNIQAYLKSDKGFNGIRGYFRILPDNTIERIYNVYQVQRNGPKWQWKLPIDTTIKPPEEILQGSPSDLSPSENKTQPVQRSINPRNIIKRD